jgi:hypothetical protein
VAIGTTSSHETLRRDSDAAARRAASPDVGEVARRHRCDTYVGLVQRRAMSTDEIVPMGADSSRGRRWLVTVLAILGVITLLVSTVGIWAKRNVLDTDRFVSRVDNIAADPDVDEAVSIRLTDAIMQLLDPQAFFEDALPGPGKALAIPLTSTVRNFVDNRVTAFVASPTFDKLLTEIVRVAHQAAVKILEGNSKVIEATDGKVTLNLLPLIDRVLQGIGIDVPNLLDTSNSVPQINVSESAPDAIQKLASALNTKLDSDFGQITIYNDDTLEAAQQALKQVRRVVIIAIICTVLAIGGALWLSRSRRRTLVQIAFGAFVGLVLLRRVLYRLADEIASHPANSVDQAAARAVVDEFIGPLLTGTAIMLAVAAIVAVVALVTGPYEWAESVRGRGRAIGTRHREVLQVAGAVVGVVLLWVLDLSWFGILLLLALVALYEIGLQRLPAESDAGGTAPPDGGAPTPGVTTPTG